MQVVRINVCTLPRLKFEGMEMRTVQRDNDVGVILKAITFAASKQRDQRRKDANASPYNHPIALAGVLWHEGDVRDPIILAAALLPEELRGAFGERRRDGS